MSPMQRDSICAVWFPKIAAQPLYGWPVYATASVCPRKAVPNLVVLPLGLPETTEGNVALRVHRLSPEPEQGLLPYGLTGRKQKRL